MTKARHVFSFRHSEFGILSSLGISLFSCDQPVQVLVQEGKCTPAVDGVWTDEPFDLGPLSGAQLSRVKVSDFGKLVGDLSGMRMVFWSVVCGRTSIEVVLPLH